ncbi:MAG: PIN domain-containing protein [Planctomycetes bacterium]|nr:PIN domain-containing protein [Planctomycetota bacterium]
MNRIFCDANVLVDYYSRRLPWSIEADAFVAAAQAGRIVLSTSALSVAHIHYLTRQNIGLPAARTTVRDCLVLCDLVPVDRTILEKAYQMVGGDFEDNIQIACVIQAHVDAIMTRDARGFAHSPVLVLTPPDLMARLSGSTPP